MKPSLITVIGAVSLLAAPALAGKPRVAPEKKASISDTLKKLDLGGSFDLGKRAKATPVGEEPDYVPRLKPLSDGQVAQVVKAKLPDVQYCWNRLPAAARQADTTAVIKLSVEASGKVTAVNVEGPKEAQKCISAAAARWTFPTAEIESEIETAVALRAM